MSRLASRPIDSERHLGLFGSTAVGVGAIVGGGILALSGTAFAATGPGALLAFAANGAIAVVTALSFAELSSAFPQSGGTYAFARRVLSVGAAFAVGWVVWFASIVASALYALGFAAFVGIGLAAAWAVGDAAPPAWLASPGTIPALGAATTVELSDDVSGAIVAAAADCDLLLLGLTRIDRARRMFGETTRKVIAVTECAALVISQRG